MPRRHVDCVDAWLSGTWMDDPHFHDGWSDIRLRPEPEVVVASRERPTIRVVKTYSDNAHPTRVAKRRAARPAGSQSYEYA